MACRQQETVVCDACGKSVPKTETRHLSLKTCCSYKRVPVCKLCWETMHQEQGRVKGDPK